MKQKKLRIVLIIIGIALLTGVFLMFIPPKITSINLSEEISMNNTQIMTIKFNNYNLF